MTEQELSQYYYLDLEVKNLEEKIAKLGYGVSSMKYSNEPKSNKIPSSIQEKRTELLNVWELKKQERAKAYCKINNYIMEISDAEIRLIAIYRFMDLLSWDQIAGKLGTTADRTTIAKKLRKFLKNSPNSHIGM